ncbi:hypothetical protein NLO413_0771 [Candidatus Neoehrlichia lotoris str. RAC413]|uniref:Uncharacterized protein n=2 Tax=Candidatus Neoehrlichia procyonis TaxID=467750 RepID=A0A0F3NMU8_9RICK|nr:hypothetical protein NLO413_0771 [Candidatus Neoehrlichia lotoris str. RAC413]
MFFYRFMLLSYILSNMKGIFSKIIFFIIFSYLVSATLIIFTEGFSEIFVYKNPKNVYIYSFNYFKWYYYNLDTLTYSRVFKIGSAFIFPYWIQITIWNIKWKSLLLYIFRYIFGLFSFYTKKSIPYNNYDKEITNDICFIKNSFMRNIESSIDNMMCDIFNVNNKVPSQNYNIDVNFIKSSTIRKIEGLVDNMIYEVLMLNRRIDKK